MAQERHENRFQYFQELAQTSRKYFAPYISKFKELRAGMRVLEVGCGDGGNLLPFVQMGCRTVGTDIAPSRVRDATCFFKKAGARGRFVLSDIFKMEEPESKYDVIICHDVFEHVENKRLFLNILKK